MSVEFDALFIPQNHTIEDTVRAASLTGIPQTLAALGSSKTDAAPILRQTSSVTGADAVKGVILPATDASGRSRIVTNAGTAVLLLYPPSGGTIDDCAVDAPVMIGAGLTHQFLAASALTWYTIGQRAPHIGTAERTFTETTGAGVYTASVTLPAGSTLHDIFVNGVSLWTAATSATLTVGDAGNASGYFAAVNLKATDLLAGESISFDEAGGKAGAYIANSQVSPRYSATARVISGVVTTVGTTGNAGVTRMTVVFSVNPNAVAATKV